MTTKPTPISTIGEQEQPERDEHILSIHIYPHNEHSTTYIVISTQGTFSIRIVDEPYQHTEPRVYTDYIALPETPDELVEQVVDTVRVLHELRQQQQAVELVLDTMPPTLVQRYIASSN